jgi:hypothetical protein
MTLHGHINRLTPKLVTAAVWQQFVGDNQVPFGARHRKKHTETHVCPIRIRCAHYEDIEYGPDEMGSLDDDLVGYTLPIDTLGRCQTDSMHY